MTCAKETNFFFKVNSCGVLKCPDRWHLDSAFNACKLSSCLFFSHKTLTDGISMSIITCDKWQPHSSHGSTYNLDYLAPWAWCFPWPCPSLSFVSCACCSFLLRGKSCGECHNLPAWISRHWDWEDRERGEKKGTRWPLVKKLHNF